VSSVTLQTCCADLSELFFESAISFFVFELCIAFRILYG